MAAPPFELMEGGGGCIGHLGGTQLVEQQED